MTPGGPGDRKAPRQDSLGARRTLRFGYWLPVFGGWLRNVEDEGMPATWEYVRDLAARSERIGFDLTLIAELNYSNYGQWLSGTKLEQRVSLEDYSVSNRGLRSGLVGTPEKIAERLDAFERAGADLTLLQFSPQAEEMERFAEEVIAFVRGERREVVA